MKSSLISLSSLSGQNSRSGRTGRIHWASQTIWANKTIQAILILLLAFGLRLIALGSRPLWYDEAFAVLFAEKGFAAMLAGTLTPVSGAAADVHPLLYYTGLWVWMGVFGQHPVLVRLPGVFAGLVTLSLAWGLMRNLLGEKAATAGGLFLAVSPFLVHYAQEARMYSFLAMWLTGATWAYWRLETGDWRLALPAFAVLAALAQYTHNLAALYLVTLALTPLWLRRWRTLGRTTLAGLAALALYLPWLLNAPSQFAKLRASYWITRPGPAQLLATLMNFTVNLPVARPWLPLALAATLLAAMVGVYSVVRRAYSVSRIQNAKYRMQGRCAIRDTRYVLWLFYLGAAPVLLMFLVSQVQPVYIDRAMLPAAGMYLLALSWALTQSGLPRPISVLVLLVLVLAAGVGLVSHYTYAGFPNSPFVELDCYLRSVARPDDVILHSNKLSFFPAHYYDRNLPQSFLADPPGIGSDTLAYPTQQSLGLYPEPDLEAAVGDARRVWFVIYERAISEYQAQGVTDHPHMAWLQAHLTLAGSQAFNDLKVYEFTR